MERFRGAITCVKTDTVSYVQERDNLRAQIDCIDLRRELAALESHNDLTAMHGPAVKRPLDFYETLSLEEWTQPDVAAYNRDGHFGTIFRSEQELALYRGIARILASGNETAIGVMANLSHYVIHTGLTMAVNATKESTGAAGLKAEANRVIDEFIDHNEFDLALQEELFWSTIKDGEGLIALEADGQNVRCRIPEPSWLTQPRDPSRINSRLNVPFAIDWRYGVATQKGDTTNRVGYFIQWEGDPQEWRFYPSSQFVHLRRNVPRRVKRGLTDFYPVSGRITGASELLQRIGTGAGIQASIALLISSEVGAGGGGPRPLTGAGASGTAGRSWQADDWKRGTVVETRGNQIQAGPMGGTQAGNFVQVLQAMLRATAVRWNMPEHMISGDASNNNYASILEASAPFTRSIEAEQGKFCAFITEALWRVLHLQFLQGRFNRFGLSWPQIRQSLEVVVSGTSPAVRDKNVEIATTEMLDRMKIISRRTVASRFDVDLDEENENNANDGAPQGQSVESPTPGQSLADPRIASALNVARESLDRAGMLRGFKI